MINQARIVPALVIFLAAATVNAETYTVCAEGCNFMSINRAIETIDSGDTIQLMAEVYREGEPINTLGKAIDIRGETDHLGNPLSILDGSHKHRVLECTSGELLSTFVQHVVIRNGFAETGGGMLLDGSFPTINNCVFLDNHATVKGGAIMCIGIEHGNIWRSTFVGNRADGKGGAIRCEFSDFNLNNSTFSENEANDGGAISNDSGSPNVYICHFLLNSAEERGGAVHTFQEGDGQMRLTGSNFAGNTATLGGGLHSEGRPYVVGTMFCDNNSENIVGPISGAPECQATICSACMDDDEDGVIDAFDICPDGDDTVDSDGDGTPDACDGCPGDPEKIDPGLCGCGLPDTTINGDLDCDGDLDLDDYRLMQEGLEICPEDIDLDGRIDSSDLGLIISAWGFCGTP